MSREKSHSSAVSPATQYTGTDVIHTMPVATELAGARYIDKPAFNVGIIQFVYV